MKNICITFTYHNRQDCPDDAPLLCTITLPVRDYLVNTLTSIQEFPPILANQTNSNLRCITQIIAWYAILNLMYILGDDKILNIKPV